MKLSRKNIDASESTRKTDAELALDRRTRVRQKHSDGILAIDRCSNQTMAPQTSTQESSKPLHLIRRPAKPRNDRECDMAKKKAKKKLAIRKPAKKNAKSGAKNYSKKSSKKATRKKPKLIPRNPPKSGDVVDVVGIIAPLSGGGMIDEKKGTITAMLGFCAWKFTNGEMIDGAIDIYKEGLKGKRFDTFCDSLHDFSLRRFKLKIKKNRHKENAGYVVRDLGNVKDAELQKIAKELKKPVVVDDPDLGQLVYDRGLEFFETDLKWLGARAKMTINAPLDDADIFKRAKKVAKRLLKDKKATHKKVLDRIAKDLLDLANDWQSDFGRPGISASQMKKRVKLMSLSVDDDGATFWFDDGDVFAGHSICVSCAASGKPKDADIAG